MTKENIEWVCNFLQREGYPDESSDLIGHMEAVETIIDCALEFDYSRSELFEAFKVYEGKTK